jgi:hypothetical protein
MIEEIKIDKYKQNDYGDAAKMSAYEKTISFLNKYVVYKKISKITDVASVALELLEDTVLEPAVYKPQKKTTKKGVVVPAKKRIDLKLPKAVNLHKTIRLLEDVEIEIEEDEIAGVEEGKEGKKEDEAIEEIVINIVEKEAIKELVKEKKTRKPYTKKGALKIAEEEIAPPIAAPIAEIDDLVSKPKSKKVAKPRTKKAAKEEATNAAKEMIVEVEIPVKEKEVIKPVKVTKTKKVKPVVAFEVEEEEGEEGEEGEGEGEKIVEKEKKPKKAVKPRAKKDKEDK